MVSWSIIFWAFNYGSISASINNPSSINLSDLMMIYQTPIINKINLKNSDTSSSTPKFLSQMFEEMFELNADVEIIDSELPTQADVVNKLFIDENSLTTSPLYLLSSTKNGTCSYLLQGVENIRSKKNYNSYFQHFYNNLVNNCNDRKSIMSQKMNSLQTTSNNSFKYSNKPFLSDATHFELFVVNETKILSEKANNNIATLKGYLNLT